MIIKSMGRKGSSKMAGTRNGKSAFSNLVQYMTRGEADEETKNVLWHGFYGHSGMSEAEIMSAFEANAKFLKERKNGNVLYHEILSFSRGYALQGEALDRAVTDIGQEYLRQRAGKQMAFGAIHKNTEHIHLHLMISSNEIGKSQRMRLSKAEFAEIQKATEAYTLTHYSELAQTRIYDRERPRERLKTQVHEQAMKSRTGEASRKETIKNKLHGFFEMATNQAELHRLLQGEGLHLYTTGKTMGVVLRDAEGVEYKHRLSKLGMVEHYESTMTRLQVQETEKKPSPPIPEKTDPEKSKPSFLDKDESIARKSSENTYTDSVLKKVQESHTKASQSEPGEKGNDRER